MLVMMFPFIPDSPSSFKLQATNLKGVSCENHAPNLNNLTQIKHLSPDYIRYHTFFGEN